MGNGLIYKIAQDDLIMGDLVVVNGHNCRKMLRSDIGKVPADDICNMVDKFCKTGEKATLADKNTVFAVQKEIPGEKP